jgi:leader peptidase (prepilin peptidase)/N-methyltransferase
MKYYFYFVVFLYGLVIGSFLNVLIYRIPLGKNTVKGRSFCPGCGHTLSVSDLIPVFSYIFLGGKCRYCKTKISPRYMTVELLNAVLYLLYTIKFGFSVTTFGFFIFASSLICVFFIEAEHMIIFDRFNISIAAAGLLMFFGGGIPYYERIIGFFSVSLISYLIALFSKGAAMGGGDIKLTAAAGLVLGWKNMLLSLFLAAFFGAAVWGIIYCSNKIKKKGTNNVVPFGSFLAITMITASFSGESIIGIYMRFFNIY